MALMVRTSRGLKLWAQILAQSLERGVLAKVHQVSQHSDFIQPSNSIMYVLFAYDTKCKQIVESSKFNSPKLIIYLCPGIK